MTERPIDVAVWMHARVASRSLPCRVVASYACGRIIKYGLLFLCEDHFRSSKEKGKRMSMMRPGKYFYA
jgi:hypothetical protein